MKVSYEALQVLIFLMPGLLASVLLGIFLVREKRDGFATIVESLVYSFIIYTISSPLAKEVPVRLEPVKISEEVVSYRLIWLPEPLLIVFGVAVVLPIIVAISTNLDLHMRLLRWMGVTSLKAGGNTWLEVFWDKQRYVIVTLADGNRVYGWPEFSSRDAEEGMLYLSDPAWITEDDKYLDLKADGLFLVKKENIEHIIFTDISARNVKARETENELDEGSADG